MKKLSIILAIAGFLLTGNILAQDSDPYACCIPVGTDTMCNKFKNKAECIKYCPYNCEHVSPTDPVDTAGGIHVGTKPGEKIYTEKKLAKWHRKQQKLLSTKKS